MFDDIPVPLLAQIKCVKRELGFRERVYKRRIDQGKMTPELAEREILAMQAVLATLRGLEADRPR